MKRVLFTILVALVALPTDAPSHAQEVLTLTSPIAIPNTTTCTLDSLQIYPSIGATSQGRIVVTLKGTNGEVFIKNYDATTTPTGATLLTSLNKMNFSGANASFIAKVYQRMSTDGVCVGSVTGSPQH